MRIGLVSTPWVPVPPPAYGGLEAVVDRLARAFVQKGHQVLLAAPANSECAVPRVPGLAQADPLGGIGGDTVIDASHVAMAYAAMGDMDVIHDHTVFGPLYKHRPSGARVVVTNHGPFSARASYVFRQMAQDTAVVAISHHQASTAHGVRIDRVIHHGLDVESVPTGDGTGGYAAFLGRMCPDKGPLEAIIVARDAGVPLRIAAKMRDKSECEYFDRVIAPLLSEEIVYEGEVDQTGKYELLGGAFAMLNPIQWAEPFGLAMIEALACGTPVVATTAGSAPEIVEHGRTGFLADDLTGLAKALLDAARLDRGACREQARRRFSTGRMVADHLELYRDLL